MTRRLAPVPAVAGPELVAALRAALDGSGPALLPLPTEPAGAARVLAALRPELPLDDDDVALVVPTSGSSGQPKGVLLTGAALHASARATAERLGEGIWALALPVTHVAGLQVLVRSLLAGVAPVVVDQAADLPVGPRFASLVPTQLRRLLARSPAALASYDAVLVGGAVAPPALVAAAREAGVRVVTTYGMSETSGGCVYDGVPLSGVQVDVGTRTAAGEQADAGVLVAAGEQAGERAGGLAGERVRLSGPVLARGYRLRPDLTRAAFAGGWFSTGDVGHVAADGRLIVEGRADDMIVTGGEKVAPGAVEAALAEHPSVAEVAVVGVADEQWGHRVVAVVVLTGELTLQQAREHVAERVSRVAAPRELRSVPALPLGPSGKVDRRSLAR